MLELNLIEQIMSFGMATCQNVMVEMPSCMACQVLQAKVMTFVNQIAEADVS